VSGPGVLRRLQFVSDSHLVVFGIAGALLVAASSWWVGGVPVGYRTRPPSVLSWFPVGGAVPRVAFYLGLLGLIATWLMLGRRALAGQVTTATLRRYVLGGALPLLGALPLGRDLWAYAAQGNLAGHGLNPYAHSPADLPGPYTDQVSSLWLHSTTPYGPLWVVVSRAAVTLSGGHPTVAVLLLRLPAFAGLLLWVVTLPVVAARVGGRVGVGLWLGAASPLTLVLGIGGGHNDVLMVGLMVSGLAVALQWSDRAALACGAALIGLAATVKSPAVLAVAFAVPLWLAVRGHRARPGAVLVAGAIALVGAVVPFALISALSGLGLGWTHQLSVDSPAVSWTSLSTAVAMVGKALWGAGHPAAVDATMQAVRRVGEWLAAATAAALWVLALRRAPQRQAALACLTGALGVVSVLVPSVQPWYFCWWLVFAGVVIRTERLIVLAATVCVAFPVMTRPNGNGWDRTGWAAVILAGSLTVCVLAFASRQAP
jgi:alpha-1,6-mannosyltransferase